MADETPTGPDAGKVLRRMGGTESSAYLVQQGGAKKHPSSTTKATWALFGKHTGFQVGLLVAFMVALGVAGNIKMEGQSITTTYALDDAQMSACAPAPSPSITSPAATSNGRSADSDPSIHKVLKSIAKLSQKVQSAMDKNQQRDNTISAILQFLANKGIDKEELGSGLLDWVASREQMQAADEACNEVLQQAARILQQPAEEGINGARATAGSSLEMAKRVGYKES